MSIITPKMKQYRDEIAGKAGNCAVWFPCDDASGTTLTDAIGGAVITDASAAHNEPHSVTFGKLAGANTSGVFPVLKENYLIVLCQKTVTSEAFATVIFGSGINAKVAYNLSSCNYGAGSGNSAITVSSAAGSVSGETLTVGGAVIGDTIYHYGSVAGAGITEIDAGDASGFTAAFSAGNPTIDANVTLGTPAVRQHIYGVALFTFDKGEITTAQAIAALNEIDGNWPAGKKYLPRSIL